MAGRGGVAPNLWAPYCHWLIECAAAQPGRSAPLFSQLLPPPPPPRSLYLGIDGRVVDEMRQRQPTAAPPSRCKFLCR